jgi:hypothetical protein
VKYGVVVQIALGVVFGPLFETALFQALPIEVLSRKTSIRWQANVFASSLLFGAAHRYSRGYVFATFLIGLVFAYGMPCVDASRAGRFFSYSSRTRSETPFPSHFSLLALLVPLKLNWS